VTPTGPSFGVPFAFADVHSINGQSFMPDTTLAFHSLVICVLNRLINCLITALAPVWIRKALLVPPSFETADQSEQSLLESHVL
jgi:hypothetical protein